MDIDGWYVAPSTQGPFDSFWASGGSVTLSGVLMNGTKLMHSVTITLAQAEADPVVGVTADSGVPAAPGHYSSYDIFGVRTLEIAIEIQVVQLSH